MHEISSLIIILTMSILEEKVSKVWAELQQLLREQLWVKTFMS